MRISYCILLLLFLYATDLRAQISVVNKKGTVMSVDSSKWKLTDTNIYNKNTGNVGIGTNGAPNSSAALEVRSSGKGLLIPRIALTSATATTPLAAHVAGMIVYNTATAGTVPNTVSPGFYFNNGTKWVKVADILQADTTNDSWKDELSNTQVRLAYQSNGSTARTSGTEFVIKDDGKVGIGTVSPAFLLDVKGKMGVNGIQTIHNAAAMDVANFAGSLFVGGGGQSLAHATGTEGQHNTGVGTNALNALSSGAFNTATGSGSLVANTTGSANTAAGYLSLNLNTTGSFNTSTGHYTMAANTSGQLNTAHGFFALNKNTTGTNNTAEGAQTLLNTTVGGYNTALGFSAMQGNVSGSNGVAVGYESQGYVNNTATPWTNYNTSVGHQSLRGGAAPTTFVGNYNTALGYQTLFGILGGSNNTALGYTAGTGVSSGAKNTLVGNGAGSSITTGSSNTILGNYAGTATLNNNIVIADGDGNRRINVDAAGNTGIGTNTPAYKLDVKGQAHADSTVSAPNYTASVQTISGGAWNMDLGSNASWTLASGTNTLSITNIKAGMVGVLKVVNAGTSNITLPSGSRVINGGGGVVPLTQVASAVDILTFYYDGTNYWWTYGNNYN